MERSQLVPKYFNFFNQLVTVFFHFLIFGALLENLEEGKRVKLILLAIFMLQTILYYGGYWYRRIPFIKSEFVLIFGLTFGVFLLKGGYEVGGYYVYMMITSAFFVFRTGRLICIQGLLLLFLLSLPFRFTVEPFGIIKDSFDSIKIMSTFLNAGFIVSVYWLFTYYQRVNIQLIAAQEMKETAAKAVERHRIAQEIHDAIGHSLTALNMHLEYGLTMKESDYEKTHDLMANMKEITEEAIYNCRKSVNMLKADEEERTFDIENAIWRLSKSIELEKRMTVEGFVPSYVKNLPEYIQQMFYSTLREALTNAIKHSNSDKVAFLFSEKPDCILFSIYDHGNGAGALTQRNGIKGIIERVEAVEGAVSFYDDEDKGFCIDINLPKVCIL